MHSKGAGQNGSGPNIRLKRSHLFFYDCMSFPELLVNVRRHAHRTISFRDLAWGEQRMQLDGDLSELLQHECDHLDGILAVSPAIDEKSFGLRSQRKLFDIPEY